MKENDIEGEDEMEFKPLLFVRKEDLPNTTSKWKISEALKQHYRNAENGNQFFDVIEMKKAFPISSPTLKVAKEIYQRGLPFSSDGTRELDWLCVDQTMFAMAKQIKEFTADIDKRFDDLPTTTKASCEEIDMRSKEALRCVDQNEPSGIAEMWNQLPKLVIC